MNENQPIIRVIRVNSWLFLQKTIPAAPTAMNENQPIIRVIRVNSWLFLDELPMNNHTQPLIKGTLASLPAAFTLNYFHRSGS
jgi:hypothetical protein